MQINANSGISLFPSPYPTNPAQPAQATAAHREVAESATIEALESQATQVAEGEAVKTTTPGRLSIYV